MAKPLVNDVISDPEGIRDKPHEFTNVTPTSSDGFCLICGRWEGDSKHTNARPEVRG